LDATSWEAAIDNGAELCGGQNALARHLGMKPSNLSAAKHGKAKMPRDKVAALADLIGMDRAAVWTLMLEAHNPFRVSAAGALAGWFLMVLAVILSGAPEPAKASIGAASQPIAQRDGNIHCRACMNCSAGAAVMVA
jgi:hypothetical protein